MQISDMIKLTYTKGYYMEKLYKRELYLSKIRPFYKDEDMIKVFTGVRRCGKSSIMQLICDELIENEVSKNNIVYINLDKRPYKGIKTQDQLEKAIDELFLDIEGTKYLFIDEIQNVKDFEESINAYREEGDYSIFITGSNSYMLSGELTTKLTGRYIEFKIGTLSFYEYLEMKKFFNKDINKDMNIEFTNYILEGGFPLTVKYNEVESKKVYVQSVINEIFEKDIKRNKKIRDKSLFNKIQTYIINNFGSTTSVDGIREYLKKVNGNEPSKNTIYNYLSVLENAKIISKCSRFDLKSKKSINGEEKYYLTDLSFYFATNTDNRINYGPVLENIIYNYAVLNGYSVSIGKIGKLEVDFIVRDIINNDYAYIQVAKTIDNGIVNEKGIPVTEEREFRPLESIKDNYPKYVLTLDYLLQQRNGIKHENIINFVNNNKKFI